MERLKNLETLATQYDNDYQYHRVLFELITDLGDVLWVINDMQTLILIR